MSKISKEKSLYVLYIWNLVNNICICVNKCTCGYSITRRKENKKGSLLDGEERWNAGNRPSYGKKI